MVQVKDDAAAPARDSAKASAPRAAKAKKSTSQKSLAGERDVLKLIPAAEHRSQLNSRRIGLHTSTAGGVELAAERAWRLGCNALQIFSSSPRMWKPLTITDAQCDAMRRRRADYDLRPLVIHANYLINVAGANAEITAKSIVALRAEMQRAVQLEAEYVVLHPGSYRGLSRAEGLARACEAIARAVDGLALAHTTLLVENMAGAEFSLGSGFESLAELLENLRQHLPAAACIDTCHSHVRGYDFLSQEGYEQTMQQLEASVGLANVRVWHVNDAKAAQGSKLDRHASLGQGTLGLEPLRRLVNDARHRHAAFILETPIDEPLEDLRNVERLKSLVE